MRWLRWSLAFLMVDLLVVLFMLALVIWQLNSTVLRSTYYSELLERSDAYNFLLVDLPTVAIGEFSASNSGEAALMDRPLESLGIAPEQVVSSLNVALPAPWVQGVSEHTIDQLGGYLTGERDEFVMAIRFDDRAGALSTDFKGLVLQSDAYDLVFDEFVAPTILNTVERGMPVELELTGDQVLASVARIAPRDWVEPQFVAAVDEITPYLLGKADGFEIVIPLDDRVEMGLQEMKGLLRASGAYESLYEQLIDPLVYDSLGGSIQLPYGILLDDKDIASALREVAPPEWTQERSEQIIDDATPFFMGRVDSFTSVVPLSDIKTRAVEELEEAVSRELNDVVAALPDCKNISLQKILSSGLQGRIECLPQDSTVQNFTDILTDRVAGVVRASIVQAIPDSIVFTLDDLYETLSYAGVQNGSNIVDSVRSRVREDWVYTDEDMVINLGELAFQETDGKTASRVIGQVQLMMSEGWTFDESNLNAYAASNYPEVKQDLEKVRNYLKLARLLGFLAFLPVVLVVAGIAYVGGRDWPVRFTWAFGSMIAASLITLVLFGVVYGVIVDNMLGGLQGRIVGEVAGGSSFPATSVMIANKLIEVVQTLYNDFSGGMINRSLVVLAISIFGLIATIGWDSIVEAYDKFPRSRVLDRIRRR